MRALILKLILIFLMTVTWLGYYLVATTSGLQFTFGLAAVFTPGKIKISDLRGTLSHFTIAKFSYTYENTAVTLENVDLSWQPADLINNRISIRDVRANTLIVAYDQDNKPSSSDTSFLQPLVVNHLAFNNIDLIINHHSPHHFHDVEAQRTIKNTYRLSARYDKGFLEGQFNLNWAPAFNLQTDLDAREIDLHTLLASLSGTVNFHLHSTIDLSATNRLIGLKLLKLNGDLRHFPISGLLDIQENTESTTFNHSIIRIGRAYLKLNGDIQKQWHANWELSVPDVSLFIPSIHSTLISKGSLAGNPSNPAFSGQIKLQQFTIPLGKAETLTGSASFNLKGQGDFRATNTNDSVNFTLKQTSGVTYAPRLGLALTQLNLASHYTNNVLTTEGSFHSGEGTASLHHELGFLPTLSSSLDLSGNKLQLVNLKDYKMTASPHLKLTYAENKLNLAGDILIPSAAITPLNFEQTTTLSDDVVFTSKNQPSTNLPLNINIQLHIMLGDSILFKNDDLNAKILGNFSISQVSGQQPIATGQLQLKNGTYKAYDKILTIERGNLIYTGNALFNPGLDIRATTTMQNISLGQASQFTNKTGLAPTYTGTDTITIGALVKGTMKKPVITLFSSSSTMSQNDMLSYLLFGYPQSQLSSDNKTALLSAISSIKLGTHGVGGVTQRIKDFTGLNDVSLGSTEYFNPETNTSANATTLSLQKNISDKLSLHYSVGLSSPLTLLNIKYQLNKHLSIQTSTSSLENGVDLLAGFERD